MTEPRSPALQDHYPEDFAHCYGCGRLNTHGLHVKTRWDGEETVAVAIIRRWRAAPDTA